MVADICPTFSWEGGPEAGAYELIVFRITDRLIGSRVLHDAEIPVLIDVVIPAPTTSWTPSASECLEPGETYAWYVRKLGVYDQPDGNWSEGRMFEVDAWAASTLHPSLKKPGGGTGGIPAVLQQLDEIQVQMAEDRAALEALIISQINELRGDVDSRFLDLAALVIARANSLDTQLGVLDGDPVLPSVAGRLQEIKEDTMFSLYERAPGQG